MKNAIVRVEFNLNLPEREVQKILAQRMLTSDDGTDGWYSSALGAIEAAVEDDLPRYLEFSEPDPEVEAHA